MLLDGAKPAVVVGGTDVVGNLANTRFLRSSLSVSSGLPVFGESFTGVPPRTLPLDDDVAVVLGAGFDATAL